MNRGRIQAQGDNCEKSESWAQEDIPTKQNGYDKIESLKRKLTRSQIRQRKRCFEKVNELIRHAPSTGYDACSPISFTPRPPSADVRIDLEIIKGKAFKDDY